VKAIEINYRYFKDLKDRLELNAAQVIRLYYLRYKIRQSEKEKQQIVVHEEEAHKAKTKRKNFKSTSNKTTSLPISQPHSQAGPTGLEKDLKS
jgi:hypothetical protein